MSTLQDTIKALWNRFRFYIKAISVRIVLYIIAVAIGVLVLFYCHDPLHRYFVANLTSLENDNAIFVSALAIFLLTFPVVTLNWLLKNGDQLQQFEDTHQQQTETLFSNAVQLLFKQDDIQANSVGLKELIRLRQATEDDVLKRRIDLITKSGLELKGANLQEADLRKADLQNANLQRADLQEADLRKADLQGADLREADLQEADMYEANLQKVDLQGANLQGAILTMTDMLNAKLRETVKLEEVDLLGKTSLKGAIWNKETTFPEGFKPKEQGMIHEDDLPKEPNNNEQENKQ